MVMTKNLNLLLYFINFFINFNILQQININEEEYLAHLLTLDIYKQNLLIKLYVKGLL